jgi:hypothetical protein
MIEGLVILITILWFFGGIHIPFINTILLSFYDHPITVRDVLLFILFSWVISILPRPFREIAGVLGMLWVLSILGILAISGLTNILILAIIIGVLLSIFNG